MQIADGKNREDEERRIVEWNEWMWCCLVLYMFSIYRTISQSDSEYIAVIQVFGSYDYVENETRL